MWEGKVVRFWRGLEGLLVLWVGVLGLGRESSVENVREPPA
jgi:hypothetical protein